MKRFLILAALAGAGSIAAYATDTCTGGQQEFSDTLTGTGEDNLLVGSTNCVMGAFTFSNFDVYTQSGFQNGETLALEVTTDSGSTPGLLALSLTCTADCPAGIGDYILTYTISPGPTSMTLYDGTASSIEENICNASSGIVGGYGELTECGSQVGTLSVTSTNTTASTTVTTAAIDYVTKDIDGGSESYQMPGGIVPEPMTLSMMGAGLLGLGLFGRRLRRK